VIVSFPCPSTPHPIGGVTALYEFGNGLARRGHEVHLVHGAFWGGGIDSLADLDWFAFEPTVVHHLPDEHGVTQPPVPPADIWFGTGRPDELGLPVILVQGVSMLGQEMERRSLRTPCLKVCVASWLVDAVSRLGVPQEQLVVVPCGIDLETFTLTAPIDRRPPAVGMLFHEHTAKGWDTGWAALEAAHQQVPHMRAVVFGTAMPPAPLPDWVDFVVSPSATELARDVYDRCAVFVQPSIHEGFGLTAVEAMACGCALVTTDNGGSRDYAIPGETALVAPPRDAMALAGHIVALLTDDDRRLALAAAGERWVQRFDWDRSAELLEHHLEAYLRDPAAFRQPPGDPVDAHWGARPSRLG
jgi:glycosyltransferase involved in cell wall biosynthesis